MITLAFGKLYLNWNIATIVCVGGGGLGVGVERGRERDWT